MSRLSSFTILAAVLACAACSSSDDEFPLDAEIEDVVFLDDTTDEALLNLLATDAVDDEERRVVLDEPMTEALPSDEVPNFAWHEGTTASVSPAGVRPRVLDLSRMLQRAGRFLDPVGVAHAHGLPYNGTAFFLEFTGEDDQSLLRVFVGQSSYAMADDVWESLSSADAMTLSIRSADFENNLLTSGGGPFDAGRFTFNID